MLKNVLTQGHMKPNTQIYLYLTNLFQVLRILCSGCMQKYEKNNQTCPTINYYQKIITLFVYT